MRQVVSRADRNEIRKGWHSVWVELISSHLSTVHLESRGVSITHDDYQAVTVVGAKWKKSKANGQNMHPDMEQNNTLCYYAHFLPSFFVPPEIRWLVHQCNAFIRYRLASMKTHLFTDESCSLSRVGARPQDIKLVILLYWWCVHSKTRLSSIQ